MRILLAEDNRATRLRIHTLLTEWGHECLAVSDGQEALEQYGEFRPDMLLTDWLMPEVDGVELVRRIRDLCEAEGAYVYAIMLTALSETADIVKGFEAGADDFVKKPVDNEELRARIRAGVRIIELERVLAKKNRALLTANREISMVNRRMREDLEAAAKIQSSFLPSRHLATDHARFAWHYEPCEELSGDTLNILPLTDGKVGLYVVDVCGHGVSAALLSVQLSRLFTSIDDSDSIVKNGTGGKGNLESPCEVASHLNELFPFDPESEELQYFTMLYGILDLEESRFDYTSAGHPGPIIVPKDSSCPVALHEADPPAVGFFPDAMFTEHSIKLDMGDRMYLYTDGIFEMLNKGGEEFGESRLAETLFKQRDRPLEESIQVTLDTARKWNRNKHFEDDISLVGMEVA